MILVADNLQIPKPEIERAVREMDPLPIQDLVMECEAAGAGSIDINSGPLSKKAEERFAFLVESVRKVTTLPLLLDTVNPKALDAGLSICSRGSVINGFSLEPEKLKRILPLAKKYGTDIIGYLLYPGSQIPMREAECLGIAIDLFQEAQKAGIAKEQLIIDPVVLPLIWENGVLHNKGLLSVLRRLPEVLGYSVRTIAGLSNLTTGRVPLDKKTLMEKSYLAMLASCGLDFALLNVFHTATMQVARACDSILNPGVFSWRQLS